MYINMKKTVWIVLICFLTCFCVACANAEDSEKKHETESEERIEIIDATDVLLKIWMEFDQTEFDVIGGHYSNPAMGTPAKYDLSYTSDLIQMYCVPESQLTTIDDAATVIDLYNAARFTASAFHLTDAKNQEIFIEEMKQKIAQNEWHGEVPEKVLVVGIDETYVVAVYGREEIVDTFEKIIKKIF